LNIDSNLFSFSLASLHVFLKALGLGDNETGIVGHDWCRVLGVCLATERPSLLKSFSIILGGRVRVNGLSENSSGGAEGRGGGKGRSGSNKSSNDNSTL
jgi:hypothetical protein